MRIGNRDFDVNNHTYVMGILNVTPDSFSDGGKYNTMDAALFQGEKLVSQGADLLDIGGESSRPGHTQISPQEEMERLLPILRRLREEFDLPLSVDTCKASVAKEAIRDGADLINDIWGLKRDEKMAGVIAESGAACCLMHNRKEPVYRNFWEEVKDDLRECLSLADSAGISRERILLDPGIGFAKDCSQNLFAIGKLHELKELGCPLLLGTSRKSVIGLTLNLPVEERLEGTLVTTVYGVLAGCAFVRVHDVLENVRAVRMAEAIRDSGATVGK